MPRLDLGARSIAYEKLEGKGPGVIFLTGFKSNMEGSKALALEAFCKARGQAFLRFDYTGHGVSSGKFEDGCIGDWLQDALDVFDKLTAGPQVVVGSSMGGWIALLLTLQRAERVKALVGIAAAPDFTERLIWEKFPEEQKKQLMETGEYPIPNCYGEEPYVITKKLVEEGRKHLLLGGKIDIHCPIRLIHGTADEDVPHEFSVEIAKLVVSNDVEVKLIEGAGHRMSEPEQLQEIIKLVEGVL